MISFNCKPLSANPLVEPLVFDWDSVSGTVSGTSAELIRQAAAEGGTRVHPMPAFHEFGAEPLKSRTDMAAIIGLLHQLPTELADAYPVVDDEPVAVEVLDADGQVIETVNVVF